MNISVYYTINKLYNKGLKEIKIYSNKLNFKVKEKQQHEHLYRGFGMSQMNQQDTSKYTICALLNSLHNPKTNNIHNTE